MCHSNGKFKNRFLQASDNGIAYDCKFTIGSENVVIEGHKFMFSVASEVFKAMFYGELKENHTVKIEDLDVEGFKGMTHYIYTGEVDFTSSLHALTTYIAARKYLITELVKECRKYIQTNITPSEILEFYEYCEMHNIVDFEELCLTIIEEKTDQVVNSEYFPTAKLETVQLILKSRSLKLKSEIEVYDIFEKWALAEAARKEIGDEVLASSFQNLKKCIRFLTITSEEFSSRIEQSRLLTDVEKRAVECNLLELESKPIPENLSLVQQQRHFFSTSTSIEEYGQCHTLVVSFDGLCQSCSSRNCNFYVNNAMSYFDLTVTKMLGEYLCCTIKPFSNSSCHEKMYKMQSKVSILAVNECDDLTIINESKIFHKNYGEQSEVIFAEIPLVDLKSRFFSRGERKVLIIQVQLNFEKYIG